MGFYHSIRVVQKTKTGLRTITVGKRISSYEEPGKANEMVRRAMSWPATVRVEVEEEDTQLYAYPRGERTYQSHVIHKDGRLFKFFGKGSNFASLCDNFDARIHSFRIN